MANIASKHRIKKLLSQLSTVKELIRNNIPTVLREIKSGFNKIPGEVSQISNKINALSEQLWKSEEVMVSRIKSNGSIEKIAVSIKDFEKDFEKLDNEMLIAGKKYSDIGVFTHAVEHFHQIVISVKKALEKVSHDAWNILKLESWKEEPIHGKVLGTKMKGKH